ncbi:glycosyltransferase [Patescibacteria group bacterium]|nr:glycosyltransferase [Patescibacteria group bacterium]MBP9709558.1 glycosyltransferase [Patescibacteria group bacterium]
MELDQTKTSVDQYPFLLSTLEYPPERGGIARYLFELSEVLSLVEVERSERSFWRLWPHWLPLIFHFRKRQQIRTLLVSHVLPVGTAAMFARFLGGSAYGVFFHGMDLLQASNSVWKKWLTKKIIQYSHALFVNSHATADILRVFTHRIPVIVTPGIVPKGFLLKEQAREALGISLEEKIVLAVGRLVPRKGFDVLIESMRGMEARLVIVGDGPDYARLDSLLRDTCCVLRDVSDDERDMWYAAADVFALPVRAEKDDVEGFGIVFLEAAMAGLPVVAGKTGGVCEAVVDGKTGVLVDGRDVDEVRDAIQGLLDDPMKAKLMGEAGRTRVLEEFQWADRAKLVEDAFPLVSVIIPVYNRVHLLDATLASLARQTYRYFEVIVIDDGSEEDVEKMIHPWKERLSIRFERLSMNQGAPVARNRGFALAKSEFVLFLDHDATLERDALECFLRTLQESPEADVAYSAHRFGGKLFSSRAFDAGALQKGNYIHTTSLVRRAAFPGFDPSLKKFQDWDVWLTMAKQGSHKVWIKKSLFSVKAGGTMSGWLPSIMYRVPWERVGWMPERLKRYREAQAVIKKKHSL